MATVSDTTGRHDAPLRFTVGVFALWSLLLAAAALYGLWKLLGISVIACIAMLLGALGARYLPVGERSLLWADGVAVGAMVTSACLFLLPTAIADSPTSGGLGVAAGLIGGAVLHVMTPAEGPKRGVLEPSVSALSLHALGAGLVIGMIYASMPGLGLLLGVAIVSHKLPAGFAAARNLERWHRSTLAVILPACAVGLTAIPVGLVVEPAPSGARGTVFGFATGIFLYVPLAYIASRPPGRSTMSHPIHLVAAVVLGIPLVAALRWLAI
jgi:ZIP family zinc transporter